MRLLKVLRLSPELLNNVKIGQGQLQLIMKQILFYHILGSQPFWSSDLNNPMNTPSNSPMISELRTSSSVMVPTWGLVCWWDGGGLVLWLFVGPAGVCLLDFLCSGVQFSLLLSPCPCFISLLCLGLCVLGDDALMGWGSFVQTEYLCVLVRVWIGGGVGAVGPV